MIRISNLDLTYHSASARHHAVRGISLEIAQGQFYTLLGPSGCGKTTTLRCVAGLERPDGGEITIGDSLVCSVEGKIWVPPNERNIGMVFQSYAIWPHMTVFDNVAFPLRQRRHRPARAQLREKVEQALALVQLAGLEDRPAPFLSGGQQQRLALARALVGEPRVLLLDEPLSNLDAKLREEMRWELRELIKRLNVTTLFVTHEQIEALTMSDVIAVMSDGVIVQEGTPAQIYHEPNGRFVADFIGKSNFLEAKGMPAQGGGGGAQTVTLETAIGPIVCRAAAGAKPGGSYVIAIRPENVQLLEPDAVPAGDNTFVGRVISVMNLGNIVECVVELGSKRLRIQLHPSKSPTSGDTIGVRLAAENCLVMAA